MKTIWRSLLTAGISYGIAQVLQTREHQHQNMRSVGKRLILLVLAGFSLLIAFAFLVAAFFFSLADIDRLVQPALITAGVVAVGSILLWFQGRGQRTASK